MAGFGNAPILVKVAHSLCFTAVLLNLIGFPTPYWTVSEGVYSGLFKRCASSECNPIADASKTDITTTLVILGFFHGLACLVLTISFIYVDSLRIKVIKVVCMILAFVAAVFTYVGVIIYAKNNNSLGGLQGGSHGGSNGGSFVSLGGSFVSLGGSFGWSFYMVIIGGTLYLATGIMFGINNAKAESITPM